VRWAKWLAARGYDFFRIESPPAQNRKLSLGQLAIPILVVCALLTFAGWTRITGAPPGQSLVRLDPKHWPVGLLPELQDYAKSHKEGTQICNDYLMGGFLKYFIRPACGCSLMTGANFMAINLCLPSSMPRVAPLKSGASNTALTLP
jgi:hypothetical protein